MRIIREKFYLQDYHDLKKAVKKNVKSVITVEPYEETLSEAQRKYYFWVVVDTCSKDEKYRGKNREEIHTELKVQYLPEYEELLKQFSWMLEKSSVQGLLEKFLLLYHDLTITTSTKWEFEQYLTRIRQWEAQKGIYISLPNENNWWEWANLVR